MKIFGFLSFGSFIVSAFGVWIVMNFGQPTLKFRQLQRDSDVERPLKIQRLPTIYKNSVKDQI